jgi:hypothetical protein
MKRELSKMEKSSASKIQELEEKVKECYAKIDTNLQENVKLAEEKRVLEEHVLCSRWMETSGLDKKL